MLLSHASACTLSKPSLKQEEINLKNVEIESLKLSLNEAHEVSAMLFTEGMEITERYNELKKAKAKKCGR